VEEAQIDKDFKKIKVNKNQENPAFKSVRKQQENK
jgi:hypothetical protein